MPIFLRFGTFDIDEFLVFNVPNAKKLAFGTLDANALSIFINKKFSFLFLFNRLTKSLLTYINHNIYLNKL